MSEERNSPAFKRACEGGALAIVQGTVLEMATCLDGICRKHDLRYSLAFGSLIGAVRHKGFIPWDDDIDVLMFRDDLDRFLRIAPDELPDYYEVQHFSLGNTRRYVTRIVDNRTLMRLDSYGERNDLAIWLDIFVLDGIPDGRFGRGIQYLRILWHKAMCAFASFEETVNRSRPGRAWWQQAIIEFCSITHFGSWMDVGERLKKYDAALRRYRCTEGEACFCGVGTYSGERQTWPRASLEDLVEYEFESAVLKGPRDYDSVLSATYGDYMVPPSEGHRAVHNVHVVKHPMFDGNGDEEDGASVVG